MLDNKMQNNVLLHKSFSRSNVVFKSTSHIHIIFVCISLFPSFGQFCTCFSGMEILILDWAHFVRPAILILTPIIMCYFGHFPFFQSSQVNLSYMQVRRRDKQFNVVIERWKQVDWLCVSKSHLCYSHHTSSHFWVTNALINCC